MTTAQLFTRRLATQTRTGLTILDAVDTGTGTGAVFFTRATSAQLASVYCQSALGSVATINDAPIIQVDAFPADLETAPAEHALLSDRNTLLALRNGQPVEIVTQWLFYHHDFFDVTGAILVNRGPSGQDSRFIQDLTDALAESGRDLQVILIESDIPLGHPEQPHEHHPFCVAEAPGKDRMEIPPADPWFSPLYEGSIYEVIRARFLHDVRAVANLDLCDLMHVPCDVLRDTQANRSFETPFDIAANNRGAVVTLRGQHCYPWRVRKEEAVSFADHICVQFDTPRFRTRWCVAPSGLPIEAALKFRQISHTIEIAQADFFAHMAIRHPVGKFGQIVPQSSLVESNTLLAASREIFDFKPVRPPKIEYTAPKSEDIRTAIVTTMKNEGPFILEWLAYHQAIGVENFLVYTNDCTDGTDTMFDLLQSKGILQHRQNPFREMNLKPQHAALQAAENENMLKSADWAICMDVDEFINIKVGNGTLAELYKAVGDANMISCTWRLFGNGDRHDFKDIYTIGQFNRCAEEYSPKPHQAWGFKTLFRNTGIFKKMGVHRPKGLHPQLWEKINWVNGSGNPLPREEYRNAWRSTTETYGYDLVCLNHYAVRNAESFLVKRDRGRVNHVDRDQGLAYWFRMNNNAVEENSIKARVPMMEQRLKVLMADPEIAAQHHKCVAAHRAKIDELKTQPAQQEFFKTLTSARMEKLSRLHRHFGSAVFLTGPEAVPDDVVFGDHPSDYFFTVDKGETQH